MMAVALAAGLAGVAVAQSGPAPTEPAAQAIYERECALCHAPGGTGTRMLARRLGEAEAVLAGRRGELDPRYVRQVVRTGIGSMPAITRVEVTDAELEAIAEWLAEDRP